MLGWEGREARRERLLPRRLGKGRNEEARQQRLNRGAQPAQVTMLEDEDGNIHMRNLSMHRAQTEEDALNLLFLGDTNRTISETPMNMASSRSHCIFTVNIEARESGKDIVRRSKLNLVDLAGSERVSKTGVDGTTLSEAKFINLSLHYLEQVRHPARSHGAGDSLLDRRD